MDWAQNTDQPTILLTVGKCIGGSELEIVLVAWSWKVCGCFMLESVQEACDRRFAEGFCFKVCQYLCVRKCAGGFVFESVPVPLF